MSPPDEQTFSYYPSWPAPVRVPLTVLPEEDCPYLPGRPARMRAFLVRDIPAEVYHDFMDAGFRRSGRLIYQPVCRGCRECRPLRVPVARFRASRSQRRCRMRNADVQIEIGPPRATREKFELYRRYMLHWHGRQRESRADFENFLYQSPVRGMEFSYRDRSGTLLAVGVCDICARSLSSVYMYFDPAHARRGLGTFGALAEIDYASSLGIPYYYLGYWVNGCGAMRYKSSFRPAQVLDTEGVWRDIPPGAA